MADDTIRTRAALQSLLADNVSGDVSNQDVRDFLVSAYNWVNATIGGNISYKEGNVGIGTDDPDELLHLEGGAFQQTDAEDHGGLKRSTYSASASITAVATVTIQVNIPINTKIIGCQLHVKTALAGAETWDAVYITGLTQSIATNQAVAQNTNVNKFYDENAATAISSGEVDITIERNSNPGVDVFTAQGLIEAVVYVQEMVTWTNE